jgi:urease accessory protein
MHLVTSGTRLRLPAGRVRFLPEAFAMLNDRRVNLTEFAARLFPLSDPALTHELQSQLQAASVSEREGLQEFLAEHLESAAVAAETMIVCLGVRLGDTRSLDGALTLDAEVNAMPWSVGGREASRRMGRQALALAVDLIDSPLLLAFSIRAEAGTTPCHHCLVFGVVAGRLGWSAEAAVEGYLQGRAAAAVAAARAQLWLTPAEAQDALWYAADEIARLAHRTADASVGASLTVEAHAT